MREAEIRRAASTPKRGRIVFALKILISIVAVALVIRYVDWRQMLDVAGSADPTRLAWVFLVVACDRAFMAVKWVLLVRGSGAEVSTAHLFRAYYLGAFWGMVLPASVGGDVVRVSSLIGNGGRGALAVSSVVIERLFGALALAVFASIGVVLLTADRGVEAPALAVATFAMLTASVTAILVVFNRSAHEFFIARLIRLIPFERVRRAVGRLSKAIWHYRLRTRLLQVFLVLCLAEQVFPIVGTYLLARAFGVHIPFVWVFLGVPIILAVSRIPISIQNFGVQEGVYVFIFSLAGVPAATSVLMSVAWRIMFLIATIPGAILLPAGRSRRGRVPKTTQAINPTDGA